MKNYMKPEVEYVDFATEDVANIGVSLGDDEVIID